MGPRRGDVHLHVPLADGVGAEHNLRVFLLANVYFLTMRRQHVLISEELIDSKVKIATSISDERCILLLVSTVDTPKSESTVGPGECMRSL